MRIGERLKELREAAGMSHDDAACLIGCKPNSIIRWELGQSCPDIGMAKPLAKAFQVPIEMFLETQEFKEVLTARMRHRTLRELAKHGTQQSPDIIEVLLAQVADPTIRQIAADRLTELGRDWESSLLRTYGLRVQVLKGRVVSMLELQHLGLLHEHIRTLWNTTPPGLTEYDIGEINSNIEAHSDIAVEELRGGAFDSAVEYARRCDDPDEEEDELGHPSASVWIPFREAVETIANFNRTTPLRIPAHLLLDCPEE